ncbi:MAG: hypothetical protein BWX44_01596 [Spirochaetes bacterium ADurb.Bin001]|nr:MAG: hypothetical protein BWX44_01596 [Spirochaetes bacterium ADurb.Bin001]
MSAFCNDSSFIEHDYLVCVKHCTDALSHHDEGYSHSGLRYGSVNFGLCFHIYSACCVIQNENRRLGNKGTSYGNTLFLSAREISPTFFDVRLVMLWHIHDKVVGMSRNCGGKDLFIACIGLSISNVIAHCARKEHSFLRNYGYVFENR